MVRADEQPVLSVVVDAEQTGDITGAANSCRSAPYNRSSSVAFASPPASHIVCRA